MATYEILGGGVAQQSLIPDMPDVDDVKRLFDLGYSADQVRRSLRDWGFEEDEITQKLAEARDTALGVKDRFLSAVDWHREESSLLPDPGPTSKAAQPGHSDQILAERGAMRQITGKTPTATAEDWQAYANRVASGQAPPEFEQGYLGGMPTDFVHRTQLPATERAPNSGGNVTPWMGPQGEPSGSGTTPWMVRTGSQTTYSRPTYREGGAYSYMSRIGQNKLREWQQFFAGLGFETGPAGIINSRDVENMQAFMGMANGIPGGMTVDLLRNQVMDQVRQGVYFFRGVNESGDLLPTLLDSDAAGDLTGSGAGAPGSQGTQPITRTRTRTINQELSPDQGMLALRQVMQRQTGRAPSEDEVAEYVRQVNASFRADPTVITETQTIDPVTQTETTDTVEDETDVSPEGQALEFATEENPDERKQHLTGRYIDQINSMLGL